jgi:hypothetical protein
MRAIASSVLSLAVLLVAACGQGEGARESGNPPAPAIPLAEATSPAAPPPSVVADEKPEAVVRRYFDLLGSGDFAAARALWGHGGDDSGMAPELFESSMLKYQTVRTTVGQAGDPEGAAGSLHVLVPVGISGEVRGEPFSNSIAVGLRRCNNVPGCTAEDLAWRIEAIEPVEHP